MTSRQLSRMHRNTFTSSTIYHRLLKPLMYRAYSVRAIRLAAQLSDSDKGERRRVHDLHMQKDSRRGVSGGNEDYPN